MSVADLKNALTALIAAKPNWKSPAHNIAELIEEVFDSLDLGTNLFVSKYPDKPNNVVTVFDSGGSEQDPINPIVNTRIQVFVRNEEYDKGYELCRQIQVLLESIPQVNFDNGDKLIGVWSTSSIVSVGTDELNNSMLSSNYKVIINTTKTINR